MKTKTIKAFVVTDSAGEVMTAFNNAHSVFAPRVYKTAEGARNVARAIHTGGEVGVYPCTITYSLPLK